MQEEEDEEQKKNPFRIIDCSNDHVTKRAVALITSSTYYDTKKNRLSILLST